MYFERFFPFDYSTVVCREIRRLEMSLFRTNLTPRYYFLSRLKRLLQLQQFES